MIIASLCCIRSAEVWLSQALATTGKNTDPNSTTAHLYDGQIKYIDVNNVTSCVSGWTSVAEGQECCVLTKWFTDSTICRERQPTVNHTVVDISAVAE